MEGRERRLSRTTLSCSDFRCEFERNVEHFAAGLAREVVAASVGRRREGEAKVEAEDYSATRLNRAPPALDSSAEQG